MGLVQLPTELLLCIADHIPSTKDLYSLVRASRHFYHSLQPSLLPHNVKYNDSSALLWAASRGR
ncbi:hypothetical protein ASPBRDRAFT_110379, partial [Aspergillus brasiliensis CBS 101740]